MIISDLKSLSLELVTLLILLWLETWVSLIGISRQHETIRQHLHDLNRWPDENQQSLISWWEIQISCISTSLICSVFHTHKYIKQNHFANITNGYFLVIQNLTIQWLKTHFQDGQNRYYEKLESILTHPHDTTCEEHHLVKLIKTESIIEKYLHITENQLKGTNTNYYIKCTVMQTEKALINDRLRVSKVSWKFRILTSYKFAVITCEISYFLKK